ncbi:MAG: hypothetical protein AB1797_07325 [bacterium]
MSREIVTIQPLLKRVTTQVDRLKAIELQPSAFSLQPIYLNSYGKFVK